MHWFFNSSAWSKRSGPRFFLMENVGGLLTKHGKPFLKEFSLRASRLDYVIHLDLLDAVDFRCRNVGSGRF